MTDRHSHPTTSTKTIAGGRSARRTPTFQRQRSFQGESDPSAASIRSPSPSLPVGQQSVERDPTTSEEDEANTTVLTQEPDDAPVSTVGENPVLVGLRQTMPDYPRFSKPVDRPTRVRFAPSGSAFSGPAQAGEFLAHLEIEWRETCEELKKVAARACDSSLTQEDWDRYERHFAYLKERESSLRDDLRRFTPLPPHPHDPGMAAYTDALATYAVILKAYVEHLSRP